MGIPSWQFVGELHRRGVKKSAFARAYGIRPSALSDLLKAKMLPDEFMETLDRIAPMPAEQEVRS